MMECASFEDRKRSVLIFSSHLLSPSETFVRSQAEGLKSFRPFYVGCHPAPNGLPLPPERTLLLRTDDRRRLQEWAFKLAGRPPASFTRSLFALHPALIHAHSGINGVFARALALRLGIPLVVTFHGRDSTVDRVQRKTMSQWLQIRRAPDLIRDTSLIIAVSDFIRGRLIDRGFPPDRIVRHYIGVDTDAFQPRPTPPDRSRILFVGRLVEKKGCAYLIDAMQRVSAAVPDAELTIIGDGPLRGELEQHAFAIDGRITFLGLQPPDVVRRMMQESTLLAVPSVTAADGDTEGLPIVVLEAMASGVPVVGTNHAGIPEAVQTGVSGYLAEERDVRGLADAILAVLVRPELQPIMGAQARETALRRFNLHHQNSLLEALYYQVLRGDLPGDTAHDLTSTFESLQADGVRP